MEISDCQNLLNAVPLPMVCIAATERVVAENAMARDLYGRSALGRHYMTVMRHPGVLDAIEAVLIRGNESAAARFLSVEAARDTIYSIHAAPIGIDGRTGALVTFLDITAHQEAEQMRRDFVANVSHELRTPLTALSGFIETLQGAARDDPEARVRFLDIMAGEAARMNRLVGALLSLTRVESLQRVRPVAPVDLAKILGATLQTLRPVAERAGVTLDLAGAEAPAVLPGDADQLAQVVTNLVENAIKYGRRGSTTRVTLERVASDPMVHGPAVVMAVSDDGQGFDPIHIPRLTERFYRIDAHRSREVGGTGLGLAIVKHIVERHRGRLRIETEPGAGSRFTVFLPASADGGGRS